MIQAIGAVVTISLFVSPDDLTIRGIVSMPVETNSIFPGPHIIRPLHLSSELQFFERARDKLYRKGVYFLLLPRLMR